MTDEHKGTFTLRELISAYPDPEERRRVLASGEITIDATAGAPSGPRLSPKQVEAIKEAIAAMKMCEYEYGSDFEKSIAILKDMIHGA